MIEPQLSGDFATLMEWADKCRRLKVRANADTPLDAETARKFGAEGIGLCRTEHMFFDPARIGAVRQMICRETRRGRRDGAGQAAALPARGFHRLFRIMDGLPVTIRLLDPPLHEFLPQPTPRSPSWRTRSAPMSTTMQRRAAELHEANPMLGHRGCRLGITYPGDLRDAGARDLRGGDRGGEGDRQGAGAGDHDPAGRHAGASWRSPAPRSTRWRRRCSPKPATTIEYYVGTMIELPRAALTAGQDRRGGGVLQLRHQRPDADDLRPVARRCRQVPAAVRREGHPAEGPVRLASTSRASASWCRSPPRRGRATEARPQARHLRRAWRRPGLDRVLPEVGLDYVSCSPYRVPVARLAAAQAALSGGGGDRTA